MSAPATSSLSAHAPHAPSPYAWLRFSVAQRVAFVVTVVAAVGAVLYLRELSAVEERKAKIFDDFKRKQQAEIEGMFKSKEQEASAAASSRVHSTPPPSAAKKAAANPKKKAGGTSSGGGGSASKQKKT
eukprot:gnl/Hemi2/15503_TR5218_c0_g1_i1.p1 gnl/Hemi2/15503_TR5218_c0_g1~~gnl/Hemi2/15503_TR5218_c0_g1_i1.p1  ORF type:complete len:129 (-),score=42.32 gnl/Hemi2/15503_TR5218_c0_g1_i1:279-665(-)